MGKATEYRTGRVQCGYLCTVSSFVLGATLSLWPGGAEAGCSQSGTTVTCKGSLSGYTSDDFTFSSGVDELIFEDLDDSEEIDGGTTIMTLTDTGDDGSDDGDDGSAGNDLTITYNPGDDTGFYGYKVIDTGVEVSSQGGDGADGKDKSGLHTSAGDGGDGGAGGSVMLTMTSGWYEQEKKDSSTGIAVTSTGGAGAEGGEAEYTDDSFDDSDLYGGNGGDGGDGGTATLTISDLSSSYTDYGIELTDITTGISVSSTGGNGGNGGEARCDGEFSLCKASSGAGGAGGTSGEAGITVSDTDISMSDVFGSGIEVLSIGGDGGAGGLAKAIYADDTVENSPTNGYGAGGAGGEGQTASLEASGSQISITDANGNALIGVKLSSTGGSGGDGNDSYTLSGLFDYDGTQPGWGNGGDGGDGGSAELTLMDSSDLSVSVSGSEAVGVLLSSMGGDGGSVGSTHGSFKHDPDAGADGGAGGDGSTVSVTMDSTSSLEVTTTDTGGSMGALTLLSQGGDGGDGGDGGHEGDGNGGAGGYGGQITGNLTTVEATTSGDDAYGIYLATLGGGGGTGKSADGSGGAGSTIDVTVSSATVTTTGDGSHGIYALSQGGAGGNSSSGGGGGDADWVKLTVSGGTVNASGEDSYGIAAISSGGSAGSGSAGAAGDVSLTVGADVTVSGQDAYGLYAESTGGGGNGTIDITVDSGAVITASGDATAAVYVVNGDSNTLTNNGTITTDDLSSSSIYALKTSGGGLTVTNNGIFAGSADFDAGYTNSFTNESGGTLETGSTFDIGSTGTLTNDGTISPGGSGSVLESTITGIFTQSSDGTYLVDVSGNSTDELVFGTAGAAMAGTVEVNVITSPSASGSSIIALSSGSTLDSSGLTVSDTATTDYSLDTTNSYYVRLDWSVDMASSNVLGSASGNQSKVASHLQSVLESGGSSADASSADAVAADALTGTSSADGTTGGGLGEELSSLLNIVSVDDYLAALDTFSPQVASDTQLTSLFSSQRFSDALLSCSVREGGYRFVDQDSCVWLRTGGSGMDRSASSANRPFEQRAWQFAGGGQIEVGPDWFLGTGFSIETQSLNVDGIADSDGTFYQGGVVAKHTIANSVLSASLTAGYGDFDITRSLFSGDTATGDESLWTVSGQVSASHAFVMNSWYVKPRIDMGFSHVAMNGFTETGAGGANLTIADNEQTYVNLQPALEIGGEIRTANGALWRPKLSVGLTQYLGNAAPSTTASFADTPAGITPFTTTSEFDTTYLDIGAGLEVLATDRITVSAQGFSQVSQNITSYGGSAKLAIRF